MPASINGTSHRVVEIQLRVQCTNCGREQIVRNSEPIKACPCIWGDPKLNRQDGRVSVEDVRERIKRDWPFDPRSPQLEYVQNILDEIRLRTVAKERRG